jgi:hypothetical protein
VRLTSIGGLDIVVPSSPWGWAGRNIDLRGLDAVAVTTDKWTIRVRDRVGYDDEFLADGRPKGVDAESVAFVVER